MWARIAVLTRDLVLTVPRLVSAVEAGGGAWEHSHSLESLAHTSYDRCQAPLICWLYELLCLLEIPAFSDVTIIDNDTFLLLERELWLTLHSCLLVTSYLNLSHHMSAWIWLAHWIWAFSPHICKCVSYLLWQNTWPKSPSKGRARLAHSLRVLYSGGEAILTMSSWSHASALRMQRWVPALSLLFSFLFMLQF